MAARARFIYKDAPVNARAAMASRMGRGCPVSRPLFEVRPQRKLGRQQTKADVKSADPLTRDRRRDDFERRRENTT